MNTIKKPQKVCKIHPERFAISFCVKCGTPLCPECENFVSNRPHCKDCAKLLRKTQILDSIEKVRRDVKEISSYDYKPLIKALKNFIYKLDNFHTRRVFAFLVDIFLVLLIASPLFLAAKLLIGKYVTIDTRSLNILLYAYLSIMVSFFYFVIPTWIGGKSIGKYYLGLRVVWKTGRKRITFFSSFWRWIGMITSFVFIFLGFIIYSFFNWISKIVGYNYFVSFIFKLFGLFLFIFFSSGYLIGFIGRFRRTFSDALAGTMVIQENQSHGSSGM